MYYYYHIYYDDRSLFQVKTLMIEYTELYNLLLELRELLSETKISMDSTLVTMKSLVSELRDTYFNTYAMLPKLLHSILEICTILMKAHPELFNLPTNNITVIVEHVQGTTTTQFS